MEEDICYMIAERIVLTYCVIKGIGNKENRPIHAGIYVCTEHLWVGKEIRDITHVSYIKVIQYGMVIIEMEGAIQGVKIYARSE